MTEQLSRHTTFHLGGPARRLIVATTEQQLIDAVSGGDSRGEPVLVLGGGSNVLIADEGFDGTVVKVASRGVRADISDCAGADISVAAGETWDDLSPMPSRRGGLGWRRCPASPGRWGRCRSRMSAPMGQRWPLSSSGSGRGTGAMALCGPLPQQSVTSATARHGSSARREGTWCCVSTSSCRSATWPAHPLSRAGPGPGRRGRAACPSHSGAREGACDPAREGNGAGRERPRHLVGWLLLHQPGPHPEQAAALPAEAPRFPAGEGVKTSAAWLIQHAGFPAGYGSGPATLSTRHVLALTNRGQATTADVVSLAREIRDGVRERFGITLVPEVNLVGVGI